MRFGLDSVSMVPLAAHHGVGSSFAARYLSRSLSKVLSAHEVAAYRNGGIGVVSVFEDGAGNALLGHQQGISDAVYASEQAHRLGIPEGRPIFFACDFDPAGSPERIHAYFEGVRQVLPVSRIGIYGGYETVKYAFDAGLVAYGWQTYAWSAGRWDHRAQIQQYSNGHTVGGVGVDFNRTEADDFGQWFYRAPRRWRKTARGVANAALHYDLAKDSWDVRGTRGRVRWGHGDRTVKAEVELCVAGKGRGQWRVVSR